MKALILATNSNSLAVKKIVLALEKREIQYDVLNPSELFLMINHESNQNSLFNDKNSRMIKKSELKSYDIIIPRIGQNVDFSCEVLKYLEQVFKIKTLQSSQAISNAYSKIRTSTLLEANGIKTPKTVFVNGLKNKDSLLKLLSNDNRYVIKINKGSQGKQVSIVSGIAETKSVLDTIGSLNKQLIIQDFVESDGADIRVIVCGDKVIAAYQRDAGKNELRNNISKGGTGVNIKLSQAEIEFSINCAKALGLQYAGIDLMRSLTGELYCIEVNHCPGTNVQKFSDVDIATEIVRLAIKMVGEANPNNFTEEDVLKHANAYENTYSQSRFKYLYLALKGKLVKVPATKAEIFISSEKDLQKVVVDSFGYF